MGGRFDSNWNDGVYESWVSCPTCHNVHGSSQLSMIRDGRLIDKEPGLPIAYYDATVNFDSGEPSDYSITLNNSTGLMFDGSEMINICSNCHGGSWPFETYSPALRAPITYAALNDADGDGSMDNVDTCPVNWQATQVGSDGDSDGWGDICDLCPSDPTNVNDISVDADHDGIGDNCDICPNDVYNDADGDGSCGSVDICPNDPLDDTDSDGVCGDIDNCPVDANASQADSDGDLIGNACDNCPDDANYNQADSDSDGTGDACDVSAMTPDISGGQLHTIALKADGTVWAWGENTYGQLGGFTTTETCVRATISYGCSTTPVQVLGESGVDNLENISKISTNPYGEHNLALDNSGNVWAWGDNSQGQLGNGATGGTSSTPVKVLNVSGSGPLTDVVDIAAGENWSLAVKSDGTVWAWGSDSYGNLGMMQ